MMFEEKRKNVVVALFFMIIISFCLSAGCDWIHKKKKIYRVGVLSGLDFFLETEEGLKKGLAELGYHEGENIIYYDERTNFEPEKEERIIKKFIEDKVDVIFTFPTEVSLMAKNLTKETGVPVVFANANIEGIGLVDSIRHPGGNITGVRYPGPDLAVKRLDYLLKLLPNAKRIMIPYQEGYPNVGPQLEVVRQAAAAYGVTLVEESLPNPQALRAFLESWDQSGENKIDAILFLAEPLTTLPESVVIIGKFAEINNVPFAGSIVPVDGYESIFSVSTRSLSVGKQAAFLVGKVLQGTPAGTIPVVSAESYFRINYRAATEDFGLEVPPGLLSQANEIIR